LTLTSATPQTVTNVEIDLAKFEGNVTAISGNTITISGEHLLTRTVNVTTTTTYTLDSAPSTLSAITVGSEIGALGLIGSMPDTLNAISVKIHQHHQSCRTVATAPHQTHSWRGHSLYSNGAMINQRCFCIPRWRRTVVRSP
jgi:hypothetical protein